MLCCVFAIRHVDVFEVASPPPPPIEYYIESLYHSIVVCRIRTFQVDNQNTYVFLVGEKERK